MGSKTTSQTTSTTIPKRSSQEQRLMDLFEGIASQAGLDLGNLDLNSLLSGEGLTPTQSDRDLVAQSLGHTGDIVNRQFQDIVRQGNLGLDETLAARGIQGSSRESVERGVVSRDAGRQSANILSGAQQQGAQALQQLPFQRAQAQLSANQALFQRLGLGQLTLDQSLQERLAQSTSNSEQTTSGIGIGELASIGGGIFGGPLGAAAGNFLGGQFGGGNNDPFLAS